MPQTQADVLPFSPASNSDILNAIRGYSNTDYQNRVPAATKADQSAALNAMWNYPVNRNQFADALMNVIGDRILRYRSWNNPLAVFKRGMMTHGETIEDVALGLLPAYRYSQERDALEADIFGKVPNEQQSRFHRVNRQDYYKVSVNLPGLRRAFEQENRVSAYVSGLMSEISTSDQWDEFLLMARLFRIMYDAGSFFQVNIPNILSLTSTTLQADTQNFLRQLREWAALLQYPSRLYNPAKMPVFADPNSLILVTTPRAQATIDVDALAVLFNTERAQVQMRTVIIPDQYLNIPNGVAILTTKDFFVVADTFMEMQNSNNPVALHQNYFWHHHSIISATPFVPAILFTTDPSTAYIINNYIVSGISAITMNDNTGTNQTSAVRGSMYEVVATAQTTPTGGPNFGVNWSILPGQASQRTRITQTGILTIGNDETATSITVQAVATDDTTFRSTLVIPLTGAIVDGGISPTADNNAAVLSNKILPKITPSTGNATTPTVFVADNGTWDPSAPDSFTYQWNRVTGGTPAAISGATTDTYTAASADVGNTLTCTVTAVKAGFTSVSATSRATQVITAS